MHACRAYTLITFDNGEGYFLCDAFLFARSLQPGRHTGAIAVLEFVNVFADSRTVFFYFS